MTKSKI